MRRNLVRTLLTALAATAACLLPALGMPAPAAAAPGHTLTFATFNVCKAECGYAAPTWAQRRDKVARVITASGADVIGLQEATQWGVDPQNNTLSQWEDIRNLVSDAGYRETPTNESTADSWHGHEFNLHCVNGSHLLYRPSSVAVATAADGTPAVGITMLGLIAPQITNPDMAGRAVDWAYFIDASTGSTFLAISMHLPTEKTTEGEAARVAAAHSLDAWITKIAATTGMGSVPVVLLADLNSADGRQPKGAQTILRNAGWGDAWNAPQRSNVDVNTVNYTDKLRTGWPAKPIRNKTGIATRIDYIMFKGGPKVASYKVDVHVTPSGAFDPAYRASDHNLVRATLRFP